MNEIGLSLNKENTWNNCSILLSTYIYIHNHIIIHQVYSTVLICFFLFSSHFFACLGTTVPLHSEKNHGHPTPCGTCQLSPAWNTKHSRAVAAAMYTPCGSKPSVSWCADRVSRDDLMPEIYGPTYTAQTCCTIAAGYTPDIYESSMNLWRFSVLTLRQSASRRSQSTPQCYSDLWDLHTLMWSLVKWCVKLTGSAWHCYIPIK